jgi:hypothetical protein
MNLSRPRLATPYRACARCSIASRRFIEGRPPGDARAGEPAWALDDDQGIGAPLIGFAPVGDFRNGSIAAIGQDHSITSSARGRGAHQKRWGYRKAERLAYDG